jgi:hypothetical protein
MVNVLTGMQAKKKRLEKYSPSERQMGKRVSLPTNERYCGNCICFHDEDADGMGFCHENACEMSCDEWCDRWDDTESWEARVKMKNELEYDDWHERMNSMYTYTEDGFCDGFTKY